VLRSATVLLVTLASLIAPALAGKFNRKLSIGASAPAWKDLPGTDGKRHSLSDFKDKEVVVLAITCNHCPVAVAYEDRLIEFARKHAGPDSKVAMVAINVSNQEVDKLPKMKERARKKGFPFLYLHDSSQTIGRAYGATVTPEFFVLNKERKIVYMGAMDDNNRAGRVRMNYLEAAVTTALAGELPKIAETRVRGSSIKYEKK
jgi:peroxiredoxin